MSEHKNKAFFEPFEPKWKRALKWALPTSFLIKYNRWAFDNDEALRKLDKKWDSFYCKYFNWYRKLKWKYDDHLRGTFSHRIPQSWAYLKLAWYDHDWDYHYFLKVVKFKLERTEKCIRKHDRHLTTQDSCDQMKLALECLNRFIENDTTMMAADELDTLYPQYKEEGGFLDGFKRKVWLDKNGKKNVVYESPSRDTSEKYQYDHRRLINYYHRLNVADFRVFCHIMTPGTQSFKESEIDREYAKDIYDKYGYEGEAEKHLKYIHSGILGWWD